MITYNIAKIDDLEEILILKNEVKQKVIDEQLPIWQNGYPQDELIKEVCERTYLVEASMKLDDINDELDTTLGSEDFDSIGGIIIENLQRLPEDNEEVQLPNGILLKVQGMDQNRIVKVLMTLPEPATDDVTDENGIGVSSES